MHVANTIVNKPYSFIKSIPYKNMHLDLLRNEEIWIQYLEDIDSCFYSIWIFRYLNTPNDVFWFHSLNKRE